VDAQYLYKLPHSMPKGPKSAFVQGKKDVSFFFENTITKTPVNQKFNL
jgi:hypothetical protein